MCIQMGWAMDPVDHQRGTSEIIKCLLAMWFVHVRLFPGLDMASTMGLAIVAQNIVGSLFNSHISQVTQGMLYCVGVGLLGAVVMHRNAATRLPPDRKDA